MLAPWDGNLYRPPFPLVKLWPFFHYVGIYIYAMVKSRFIGDGHLTFNRNPYNGYINPYYWVDEFIPYYMELMGV